MKSGLIIALIIVAFIAGYFTGSYSSDTTSMTNLSASTESDMPASGILHSADGNALRPVKPVSQPQEREAAPSSIVASDSMKPNRAVVAENGKNSSSELRDMDKATSPFPLAQNELEEWQVKYKERLKSSMTKALGDVAELMFEPVSKNSPLLNEMTAESALENDLAWRYEAEQAITDFIANNATDPTMEMLNIACIQKHCEVTLAGTSQSAVLELLQKMQQQKPYGLRHSLQPVFYNNDDDSYWLYLPLVFD